MNFFLTDLQFHGHQIGIFRIKRKTQICEAGCLLDFRNIQNLWRESHPHPLDWMRMWLVVQTLYQLIFRGAQDSTNKYHSEYRQWLEWQTLLAALTHFLCHYYCFKAPSIWKHFNQYFYIKIHSEYLKVKIEWWFHCFEHSALNFNVFKHVRACWYVRAQVWVQMCLRTCVLIYACVLLYRLVVFTISFFAK